MRRKTTNHDIAKGRFAIGSIYPEITKIAYNLRNTPGVKKLTIAGSARRIKETIGNLNLIVITSKPKLLSDKLATLSQVKMIAARGEHKTMVRLGNGLDIDLRIVPARSYGAALLYFTGSREHTIELRRIAIKKGYTLNKHGLFKKNKTKTFIAGTTEVSVYKALGLQPIPPELREMQGEIELAKKKNLPKLIGYHDIKGDLQVQTNRTDGSNSIEEMAIAARAAGLSYIAITDHTKGLTIAKGNTEKEILKQIKEIAKLNKKFKGRPYILTGAEVNITKEGTLDIDDAVLAQLDIVGISVHSHFGMPKAAMTTRICKAMQNPHADILFHPTGRHIHRKPAYAIDIDEIIHTAKKTNTVLEIDAAPRRLDLKDSFIKKAVEAKIKLCIDSDAHHIDHFDFLTFGIGQARRGWAGKSDIINTYPKEKMLKFLKDQHN